MYSFNKHVISSHWTPGTVLSPGDAEMNNPDKLLGFVGREIYAINKHGESLNVLPLTAGRDLNS